MSLISDEARNLIIAEEISSKTTYNKKYRRPEWPGGESGVTVGIGYDCGYQSAAKIRQDWSGLLPEEYIRVLADCAGIKAAAAKAKTKSVKSKVDVSWDAAIAEFDGVEVPRWVGIVGKALPNTELLSADCLGALVSLAYNRGASFSKSGERYKEMRAIKAHMATKDFDRIPDEFRSMKRLWAGTSVDGLVGRREREAKLFERGLIAAPAAPRPRPIPAPAPAPVPPVIIPAPPIVPEGLVQGDPELWHIQRRLRAMNYSPGGTDGKWGSLTIGAIAGFAGDRNMSLPSLNVDDFGTFRTIQDVLKKELSEAEAEHFTRPMSPERSEATASDLAPKLPEVDASTKAERLGFWGSIATAVSAVITGISKAIGDAVEWLNPLKALVGDVPWQLWVGGALLISGALYYISRKSGEAKNASVDAFRAGDRT